MRANIIVWICVFAGSLAQVPEKAHCVTSSRNFIPQEKQGSVVAEEWLQAMEKLKGRTQGREVSFVLKHWREFQALGARMTYLLLQEVVFSEKNDARKAHILRRIQKSDAPQNTTRKILRGWIDYGQPESFQFLTQKDVFQSLGFQEKDLLKNILVDLDLYSKGTIDPTHPEPTCYQDRVGDREDPFPPQAMQEDWLMWIRIMMYRLKCVHQRLDQKTDAHAYAQADQREPHCRRKGRSPLMDMADIWSDHEVKRKNVGRKTPQHFFWTVKGPFETAREEEKGSFFRRLMNGGRDISDLLRTFMEEKQDLTFLRLTPEWVSCCSDLEVTDAVLAKVIKHFVPFEVEQLLGHACLNPNLRARVEGALKAVHFEVAMDPVTSFHHMNVKEKVQVLKDEWDKMPIKHRECVERILKE